MHSSRTFQIVGFPGSLPLSKLHQCCAKYVAVRLQIRQRSITLSSYVSSGAAIYEAACKLLLKELPVSVRLMGIRVSSFKPTSSSASQPQITALLGGKAPPAAPAGTGSVAAEAEGTAQPTDGPRASRAAAPVRNFCSSERAAAPARASMGTQAQGQVDHGDAGAASRAPSRTPHAAPAAPGDAQGAAGSSAAAWRLACPGAASGTALVGALAHPGAASGSAVARGLACPGAASNRVVAGGLDSGALTRGCSGTGIGGAAAEDGARSPTRRSTGAALDMTTDSPITEAADGPTVRCPECGSMVALAAMPEHEDWHVAQRLSAHVNGPGYIAAAEATPFARDGAGRGRKREAEKQGGRVQKRGEGGQRPRGTAQHTGKAVASAAMPGLRHFFTRR